MGSGASLRRRPNEEASTALGLLLLIVLAFAVFSWSANGFSSPYNQYALTRTAGLNVLLGLAMMLVIATGGLDLSIGAIGVASAMFAGHLMQDFRTQTAIAIFGALCLGGALGFCNGFVVVFARVHSFIVTLASMSIIFGAMIVLTKAEAVRDLPASFLALGRDSLARLPLPHAGGQRRRRSADCDHAAMDGHRARDPGGGGQCPRRRPLGR